MTVLAAAEWRTNGHLIADVATLGYIKTTDLTLDVTWGRGTFWREWQPDRLIGMDLNVRAPHGVADFRHLPYPDETFDVVVFDPPYKLNGTPALGDFDGRYGVDVPQRWQDKHAMIRQGITECARVLRGGGTLLFKCQDQVCSGKIRWQTDDFTIWAYGEDLDKIDRFDMLGGSRPQPSGRRQVHAQHRPSTLLVFTKNQPKRASTLKQ